MSKEVRCAKCGGYWYTKPVVDEADGDIEYVRASAVASVDVELLCPLRAVENVWGTWDVLVDGCLTRPRMTQWTKGSAEEIVRLIHGAYVRADLARAAEDKESAD